MKITLNKLFNAHMHWREGEILRNILHYGMKFFSGGIGMSNLKIPTTNPDLLREYTEDINEEIALRNERFLPCHTFYLSPSLRVKDLKEAWLKKLIFAVKYFPKGATTNSDAGAKGFDEVSHLLEVMQELDIPLLIHGETPMFNGKMVDDFDREKVFLETEYYYLRTKYPNLRIVLEHVTTELGATCVRNHTNTWGTLTPHHLLFDRRAIFNNVIATVDGYELTTDRAGISSDFACRPILKREKDVHALRDALKWQVITGAKKFGLGTDSAYHDRKTKYCARGKYGIFLGDEELPMYMMAFEAMGILDHMEVFGCEIMPEFYGVKDLLPAKQVVVEKKPHMVPIQHYNGTVPFAGQTLPWTATVID